MEVAAQLLLPPPSENDTNQLETEEEPVTNENEPVINEYDVESNDNEEENEKSTSQFKGYEGKIESIKYLDKDNLILLNLNNGEKKIIDLEGNIVDSPQLNSDYLSYSFEEEVVDLYENNVEDRFITDPVHEDIVGFCEMESKSVVIVRERKETPTESLIIIKVLDEKGNELCRVDTNNPYFDNESEKVKKFSEINNVYYAGENVCSLWFTEWGAEGFFSINVDTGAILNPYLWLFF